MRTAIEGFPGPLRVAVLGTGSFSLEIGGPKIDPGKRNSVPDLAWSKHIHGRIRDGRFDELVEAVAQTFDVGGAAGLLVGFDDDAVEPRIGGRRLEARRQGGEAGYRRVPSAWADGLLAEDDPLARAVFHCGEFEDAQHLEAGERPRVFIENVR